MTVTSWVVASESESDVPRGQARSTHLAQPVENELVSIR
jgi:hypothetical protein